MRTWSTCWRPTNSLTTDAAGPAWRHKRGSIPRWPLDVNHGLYSNTKGLLMNLSIETLVMYGGMLAILLGSLAMEISATIRRMKDDE